MRVYIKCRLVRPNWSGAYILYIYLKYKEAELRFNLYTVQHWLKTNKHIFSKCLWTWQFWESTQTPRQAKCFTVYVNKTRTLKYVLAEVELIYNSHSSCVSMLGCSEWRFGHRSVDVSVFSPLACFNHTLSDFKNALKTSRSCLEFSHN